NGSGKTTLIKLINNLIQPSHGEIYFLGKKLSLDAKTNIAYLPERSALNMGQTVESVIKMYEDFFFDFVKEDTLRILKVFDIPLKKRLSQLSKGQRGKVQLALTLGRKVSLYILDEPLDGMDPASRDLIMKLIVKFIRPQSTVIISTHQITDIEAYLDYALLLKQGNLFEQGTTKSLVKKYDMTLDKYFKEVYKYDEKII
ncbi:MAG TPA: ABC transporter ATP-binding protein, partial [Acholeplasmataceae bacterium]|nr:ABC transporter ATP-binding protein [Acholeplasmataceae bacterium]